MKKYMGGGSNLLSVVACCAIFLAVNAGAIEEKKLQAVEVNSVGDAVSESGIEEGILNKQVASGPLAGKKVLDMPYQINTMTKEMMNHQGVVGFEDAVKYFPSAQIQYRGGAEVGRPQTRGFEGSVVGNVFWDGFYAISTTAIPMYMFESLQIQNGLAGSLYGGQNPAGIFNYTRKRPVPLQNIIWADYTSRKNAGIGLDTSDKFEKVGYRGVFYVSGGERQAKNSDYSRRLASLGLDFYPTENLTFETNFSYYQHKMEGMPSGFGLPMNAGTGTARLAVPRATKTTKANLEPDFGGSDLKTKTASIKFKYAPTERWYFEGGYQWQEAIRDMYSIGGSLLYPGVVYGRGHPRQGQSIYGYYGQSYKPGDYLASFTESGASSKFVAQSWFLKTTTDFETAGIEHNLGIATNGYRWSIYGNSHKAGEAELGISNIYHPKKFNKPDLEKGSGHYKSSNNDMYNIALADDIKFNENFSTILSVSNSWFKNKDVVKGKKTYDKNGLSYAASFIYKPVENVSVYITYADSLMAGSSYTYTSGVRNGQTVVLKPYRSKQYEIGAKARINELDLSAALFEIKRPIAYLGDNGIYSEQGTQKNVGLELTAGGVIVDNLSVFGGITLLDPKIKDAQQKYAENKYVVGEPRIQSNLLFDYVVPNTNKLAFTTNFHYTGKRYVDSSNTYAVPSYFTTDVGVRYVTNAWLGKQTTIRFNVNNLFDKKYWAGMFPTTMDGVAAGRGTSLFLGQSRTFMLSAEVKF